MLEPFTQEEQTYFNRMIVLMGKGNTEIPSMRNIDIQKLAETS